jgi:integrase
VVVAPRSPSSRSSPCDTDLPREYRPTTPAKRLERSGQPTLQTRSHVSNRDAARRRRPSPFAGDDAGLPPRPPAENKGLRFPADPPPVEEIIAVMRATNNNADGARLRALIIVLWRAGLRISEALDLAKTDLDRPRGALTVRRGKGGRRREVGMDRWAWDQLTPYLEDRATLPAGALSA